MIHERILKMTVSEAEATLASLRAEIVEETPKLAAIYAERDAVVVDRAAFSGEKEAWEKRRAEEAAEMASARAEIAQERANLESEARRQLEISKRLKEQDKLALKDLEWVNDKIIKGREEIEQLSAKIGQLEKEIEEKRAVASGILALENEVASLEEDRNAIRVDCHLAKEDATAHLKKVSEEVAILLISRDAAIEERNQAEYALKDYSDQLATKREDFEVYVARLVEHYGHAFPDLVIKL